jgi:signal transduction histidine kinase
MDHAGYDMLAQARQEYFAWGATAKVAQLDWAYPTLRAPPDTTTAADRSERGVAVTAGTIDLLGILSASQALSSETSIERLHARVVDVLSSMTGATDVRLVLWSEDRQGWLLPAPGTDGGIVPVGETDDGAGLPMSMLRYVQRTREPLIVADAAGDDRFAGDPYFTGVGACSLLAVPILGRGALDAVLLLENRLLRGAFNAERLDSVKLIAGQLAVSLNNAQLYAEYRRIAGEQAALLRVATLVAQGSPAAEVFDAVVAEIERLLEADGVVLARYGPGKQVTVVAHRRDGATAARADTELDVAHDDITQLAEALDMRASTAVPIVVDGRRWGVAIAEWRRDAPPPPDSEERMVQFARLLATTIANAHSRDQLTASRARLLTEADAARRRVVRDLHDGAQQRLIHTVITLELAQRAFQRDGGAEPLVAEALEHARRANEELRELAHGILPADLVQGGLRGGVDALVERLDLAVSVDLPPERFRSEIEASAYFVIAEALTNIVKHAHAATAAVRGTIQDGVLRVEVRDDGLGGADPRGRGLVGINDRVTALAGQLRVDSPAGGGTVLTATLPLFADGGDDSR